MYFCIPVWNLPENSFPFGFQQSGHFAGVLELVDKLDLGSSASAYGFESLRPHTNLRLTKVFGQPLFSPCKI